MNIPFADNIRVAIEHLKENQLRRVPNEFADDQNNKIKTVLEIGNEAGFKKGLINSEIFNYFIEEIH